MSAEPRDFLTGRPITTRQKPVELAFHCLSEVIRRGGSEAAVRLAAQLFGVPACPHCDYVIQHCRCPDKLEEDRARFVALHPVD